MLIGASVLLVMSGVGALRANVMASNVDNLYSKVDTLSEQSKRIKLIERSLIIQPSLLCRKFCERVFEL